MASKKSDLELQEFLPYRLFVLANALSERLSRRYRDDFGLTAPEWRVMAALGNAGSASASEIVAISRMDKVAVSRAVKGLVKAGHAVGATDRTDRRRTILGLTPQGERVYRAIVPSALAFERAIIAQLEKDELTCLDAVLARLTAWVDA